MAKKRLSQDQEFSVMLLVLDKFLWLGIGIMAYGLFKMITVGVSAIPLGISIMAIGAVVLVLFMIIIIKEYEIIK
ncbi:hypothetical protein KY339_03345 [Candidatus Woesearchaeota archaeon]|nr:hypothetical protein [Candidatus Woesearchaeota archaeon]